MLVPFSDLQQIRAEVGPKPDEGYFRITRKSDREESGAGFTAGQESTVATVAGRLQYIGDLNPEERAKLGVVRQDVKYLLALEAFTDARATDTIIEIAVPWVAGKYYFQGQRVVPNAENGKLYRCSTPGATGATEPVWATGTGNSVADGDAVWVCLGSYQRYDLIEVLGPAAFGDYIAKRVMCNLQQIGKGRL